MKRWILYSNGVYDYYDVEPIEDFVTLKGVCKIEYLFENYEDCDDVLYRSKKYAILKYCYESYE